MHADSNQTGECPSSSVACQSAFCPWFLCASFFHRLWWVWAGCLEGIVLVLSYWQWIVVWTLGLLLSAGLWIRLRVSARGSGLALMSCCPRMCWVRCWVPMALLRLLGFHWLLLLCWGQGSHLGCFCRGPRLLCSLSRSSWVPPPLCGLLARDPSGKTVL